MGQETEQSTYEQTNANNQISFDLNNTCAKNIYKLNKFRSNQINVFWINST